MTGNKFQMMSRIIDRAINLYNRERVRRDAQDALRIAYIEWRNKTGTTEQIARGDAEWEEMMRATKPEYKALEAAKGAERKARAQLNTAVARMLEASA